MRGKAETFGSEQQTAASAAATVVASSQDSDDFSLAMTGASGPLLRIASQGLRGDVAGNSPRNPRICNVRNIAWPAPIAR
ncbi:hypothetical protein PGB34_18780 [Xenophilus arseniciresistens]|uniref:Uncharacterized protein n=1 Tax=Xenophilus arseniciresistens TaxID=1283306 RepID=A0AAE3NC50_9BURK|nr:hypothetical protein [Xenophilus arseniciresistens]MDA7418419.1 hypothetical protein [Xenophilus arseniciresistens]